MKTIGVFTREYISVISEMFGREGCRTEHTAVLDQGSFHRVIDLQLLTTFRTAEPDCVRLAHKEGDSEQPYKPT